MAVGLLVQSRLLSPVEKPTVGDSALPLEASSVFPLQCQVFSFLELCLSQELVLHLVFRRIPKVRVLQWL